VNTCAPTPPAARIRPAAAQGDALFQLPQRVVVQQRRQLRLAGHDDRQQALVLGGDVGEQPDLLEQRVRQALRLVDDEHGRFAGFAALAQQRLELDEHRRLRGAGGRAQLEAQGEHLDELVARQRRVAQIDAVHPCRLPLERRADDRRLPRAGVADEQSDPLVAGDAVGQVAERFPMNLREHQKP
jgi:hypothetical protein